MSLPGLLAVPSLSAPSALGGAPSSSPSLIAEWAHWNPNLFARNYFQKAPLLIRNLIPQDDLPNFCPLTPHQLFDLAAQRGCKSRLVLQQGGDYPWQLKHGPFDPEHLQAMPPKDWTVLVSEVDRVVSQVEMLREFFDFVPRWRIDDVMVSFAPVGASIGPHVDSYDVFLIQGRGTRRWAIETTTRSAQGETHIPGADMRVLTDFSEDVVCLLEPGDALYLPPRYAHSGVSTHAECMTYSVGFRAPSVPELLESFGASIGRRMPDDHILHLPASIHRGAALSHIGDESESSTVLRGEIDPRVVDAARAELQKALEDALQDDEKVTDWIGSLLTAPRRREITSCTEIDLVAAHDACGDLVKEIALGVGDDCDVVLRHSEGSVWAYIDYGTDENGTVRRAFFIDGVRIDLSSYNSAVLRGVCLLCDTPRLPPGLLRKPLLELEGFQRLVSDLIRRDALYVE